MHAAVIWEGDREAPTVLVLDSTEPDTAGGTGGELPPAWTGLLRQRQVVWCSLATRESWAEAERLLTDPDLLGRPIDAVLTAESAENAAMRGLIRRHAGLLRSALLVDAREEPDPADSFGSVPVRIVGNAGQRGRTLPGAEVCADVEAALAALDHAGTDRAEEGENP